MNFQKILDFLLLLWHLELFFMSLKIFLRDFFLKIFLKVRILIVQHGSEWKYVENFVFPTAVLLHHFLLFCVVVKLFPFLFLKILCVKFLTIEICANLRLKISLDCAQVQTLPHIISEIELAHFSQEWHAC